VHKADNLSTILCRCHEIWEPKLPGTLWATPGLYRDYFTFTFLLWDLRVGEQNSLGQFLSSTPAYAFSFLLTLHNPNTPTEARP